MLYSVFQGGTGVELQQPSDPVPLPADKHYGRHLAGFPAEETKVPADELPLPGTTREAREGENRGGGKGTFLKKRVNNNFLQAVKTHSHHPLVVFSENN